MKLRYALFAMTDFRKYTMERASLRRLTRGESFLGLNHVVELPSLLHKYYLSWCSLCVSHPLMDVLLFLTSAPEGEKKKKKKKTIL